MRCSGSWLGCTLSVQVSGGIAVFEDLVIETIGAGYRLQAADDQDTLYASVTDTFEVLGGRHLRRPLPGRRAMMFGVERPAVRKGLPWIGGPDAISDKRRVLGIVECAQNLGFLAILREGA